MHLFIPTALAHRHDWGFNPELYVWALMPKLGDWNFAIGYLLGGETSSRLINVGFIFLDAALCSQLVLWAGGKRTESWWACLLFLTTPLTLMESTAMQVEAIWTAYALAALLWLLRSVSEKTLSRNYIFLSAAALGFAAATKAVTLVYLPALFLPIVYRVRILLSSASLRQLATGAGIFILLGGIPYLTAYILSGNPFFPFFNEIFKSPFFEAVNFDNKAYIHGVSYDTPYAIVFHSQDFMEGTLGSPGFQWITLLVPSFFVLLFSGDKRGLLLFFVALLSLAAVFHFQSYLRYIFPTCIIISVLATLAISDAKKLNRYLHVGFICSTSFTLALNLLFFSAAVWPYRNIPVLQAFNANGIQRIVETRRPTRKAVTLVNALNETGTPVAFLAKPFAAGLKAEALYTNWYNTKFDSTVRGVTDRAAFAAAMKRYHSEYLILSDNWGTRETRDIVRSATSAIARFGSVEVRRLSRKKNFPEELLKNTELSGLLGWSHDASLHQSPAGGVIVTATKPIFQLVSVQSGETYLNKVTFRCHENKAAFARTQINWLDADRKFISTSIRVFNCENNWQTAEQHATAPNGATQAVVYGSSSSNTPIEVSRISLKK